jgi:hypothetical protein
MCQFHSALLLFIHVRSKIEPLKKSKGSMDFAITFDLSFAGFENSSIVHQTSSTSE